MNKCHILGVFKVEGFKKYELTFKVTSRSIMLAILDSHLHRDAAWGAESGWPKNSVLDGGPDPQQEQAL